MTKAEREKIAKALWKAKDWKMAAMEGRKKEEEKE